MPTQRYSKANKEMEETVERGANSQQKVEPSTRGSTRVAVNNSLTLCAFPPLAELVVDIAGYKGTRAIWSILLIRRSYFGALTYGSGVVHN